MNKTKRKIFETAMKLFAEKGYETTSIEEITAIVGIAKGTLYHHFSSKEEIFTFLVEEGMKLLQNSIEIKTSKQNNTLDKIRAIILVQIKVLVRYENIINIILRQIWGTEPRNLLCKQYVEAYIKTIQKIVQNGINSGELIKGDAELIATMIFGTICSAYLYKIQTAKNVDIYSLYTEFEKIILEGIIKEKNT